MTSLTLASSSITRTQLFAGPAAPATASVAFCSGTSFPPGCAPSAATGSRAVNVLPAPGSLVTSMSPPIMRHSRRLMARPRPVPPYFRVVELSAWENS